MTNKNYKFAGAFTADQNWISPAYIESNSEHTITAISDRPQKVEYEQLPYYLIPKISNGHSHAFQYLLAGLAETFLSSKEGEEQGDFWAWRQQMYRFLQVMTPDDLYLAALLCFHAMKRAGYERVVEFHYIHNDIDGRPYQDPLASSHALIKAAKDCGLPITLVPIYYNQSNFGVPILDSQRRFFSPSIDDYLEKFSQLTKFYQHDQEVIIGIGLHSLRAIRQEEAKEFFKALKRDAPFHIHISEQIKEVHDCLDSWKKRPVAWYLEHADITENHNLVHATHLNDEECRSLAQSSARVVLCPTTEANLGDGIFPLLEFVKDGGQWAIGSDSNSTLCPFEELRLLDYSARLSHQKRSWVLPPDRSYTEKADYLMHVAVKEGRKSAGIFDAQSLTVGSQLEGILLDQSHHQFAFTKLEKINSKLIFGNNAHYFPLDQFHQGKIVSSGDMNLSLSKKQKQRLSSLLLA